MPNFHNLIGFRVKYQLPKIIKYARSCTVYEQRILFQASCQHDNEQPKFPAFEALPQPERTYHINEGMGLASYQEGIYMRRNFVSNKIQVEIFVCDRNR